MGQGGCQALEDALVISDELSGVTSRTQIPAKLKTYQNRRLIRSAAVQGLSRFASDIIILGFDTPTKFVWEEGKNPRIENFNYAGIVTRMLQPILPIFFMIQFNFLYDGFKNKHAIDLVAAMTFLTAGGMMLFFGPGVLGEARVISFLGV